MARWRPLPAELSDDTRLLVERLRGLKDRTGLTLVELAERTAYSKSAWHRYLNGDKFPPRQAVEALGREAGADAARLLVLWGAARARHDRSVQEAASPAAVAPAVTVIPPAAPRRRRRATVTLLTAVCVLLGGAAFAACSLVSLRLAVRGASNSGAGRGDLCRGESCQGRLPHPSRCAQDARTESSVASGGYVVRLRYSPACSTVWAEVQAPRGRPAREVSIEAGPDERLTSHPDPEADPAPAADGEFSPMLAASTRSPEEACAVAEAKLVCTSEDGSEVTSASAP
jgi:transcriptional regulator with XRE-family HTH domain